MATDRGAVKADILVAGAGPAGLTVALQACDHGASVRIVDRRPDLYRPSRALILHARTLEVLRPLGVTEALLAKADINPAAEVRVGSRAIHLRLGGLPLPGTPFPHLTLVRQADVEAVLARALAARGVTVEYDTELVGLRDGADGVRATLRAGPRTDAGVYGFVAGCDGPASTVRSQAGIGWPGGPYPVEVVLADVELGADVDCGVVHIVAGPRGLLFAFPLGEQSTWRLLATRPAGEPPDAAPFGQLGPPVAAAELSALAARLGLRSPITRLAWSARVRVQHRVAEKFSSGRLYLAGDAAHAYSPATGQGMNAAIQDAANLGWKLAFASAHQPDRALLDSYDIERRPVAGHVLAVTERTFWLEAATSPVATALRGGVAPLAVPFLRVLAGRQRLVTAGLRVISQLAVNYRRSPLSVDEASRPGTRPRAGDRLPDRAVVCGGRSTRLHDLIAGPGVHVLVGPDAEPPGGGWLGPMVHVHQVAGLPGPGLTAVRPDGYVGLRCRAGDWRRLTAWLADIGAVSQDHISQSADRRGVGLCRRER